jgi:membrane-associated phospholipid phosphatase
MPTPLDQSLSLQINHLFSNSAFLRYQVELFGDSGIGRYLVAAVPVFLWFRLSAITDKTDPLTFKYRAIEILLSFPPTFLIAKLIQRIVEQSRPIASLPLEVIGDPRTWMTLKATFEDVGSFPSDHAALFFLTSTFLWSVSRRLGAVAFFLSVYFCLLRVAYGYHWTSDIIAGAVLGITIALILLKLEQFYRSQLAYLIRMLQAWPAISAALVFLVLADIACGFDILLEGIFIKILKDILGLANI